MTLLLHSPCTTQLGGESHPCYSELLSDNSPALLPKTPQFYNAGHQITSSLLIQLKSIHLGPFPFVSGIFDLSSHCSHSLLLLYKS